MVWEFAKHEGIFIGEWRGDLVAKNCGGFGNENREERCIIGEEIFGDFLSVVVSFIFICRLLIVYNDIELLKMCNFILVKINFGQN